MNLKTKAVQLARRIRGYFPERMPQGATEFNNLCSAIISIYTPAMDERSVKFVVATLLQRLGPTEAYKSKNFFALSLSRGASGQVGAYMMEEIKNEQKAEAIAEAEHARALSESQLEPVEQPAEAPAP